MCNFEYKVDLLCTHVAQTLCNKPTRQRLEYLAPVITPPPLRPHLQLWRVQGVCCGAAAAFRGEEPIKCEGWSRSLPQPWQDCRLQIGSRHVWSSFPELLLFNCDLHECVRYGNLSRNARYRLSKSTLRNGPLPPRGKD